MALLTASLAQGQTCSPLTTFVPYRSGQYRYLIVPNLQSVPQGWNLPEHNDSGWLIGCAPFAWNCVAECTGWGNSPSILLLRKRFDVGASSCPMAASEASIRADPPDQTQIWINGTDVSGIITTSIGCGERSLQLTSTPLTATGNLLAVQARTVTTNYRISDVELRGGCCPCQVVGAGHAGGGLPISCVTAPRVGGFFCITMSDPSPAGYNLLLVGPPPAANPPIALNLPGTLCAPASLYVAVPVLVLERSGNPAGFCFSIPPEPLLAGQTVVAQGAALELSGCFRFTDALRVTIVP
jgi:hypothetical protein